MARPGRNDPCPCGSGMKAKACCLARGELDVAAVLVEQPSPAARLTARWLSAARRRFDDGRPPDETVLRRAEQYLRVSRGWNPDGFDAQGGPAGDLTALSLAFNGQASAVYSVLAIGLAHLLLDNPALARAWLDVVSGPREETMREFVTAGGLPAAAFAGLPAMALGWVDAVEAMALTHAPGQDGDVT